jgi:hypothetical protein
VFAANTLALLDGVLERVASNNWSFMLLLVVTLVTDVPDALSRAF